MGVRNILLICCISSIFVMVSGNDGAFNIHGGFYEVYKPDAGKAGALVDTGHKWGESSTAGNNRKEIAGTEGICWTEITSYCKLKFVVSDNNVPNEEHYQIKGAKIFIHNLISTFLADTAGFGIQDAYNGVEQFEIAEGQIWSQTLNAWGYGYLHLFVNKTTRPSIADAFLVEQRHSVKNEFSTNANMIGQKDPKSKEQFISTFRSWTNQWKRDTVTWWKLYIAQTKLVKHSVIYDEKVVTPVTQNLISSLTLENRGSMVTSDTFAKVGTSESITMETSTSMETTFDFSIDVGSSASIDVGFVATSVEVNLHAGYSSTEASSSTTTKTTQKSIQWPSTCPDGMKLTIDIYKNTVKQTVPIEFTFERNGVQWKERKTFEATVNTLTQVLTDCCLKTASYVSIQSVCGHTSMAASVISSPLATAATQFF